MASVREESQELRPKDFVIHFLNKLALTPYRSAMLATDTPGLKHSPTNSFFACGS